MRAIAFSEYGNADVLALQDLPEPQPAAGQVSIRVAYADVNYMDTMLRKGQYRADHLPAVPGFAVAGHIHKLGEGVTDLRVGQPVSALTRVGGYAEFALASAELTIGLDSFGREIELTQAAAFPVVGITAYHLLADLARMRAGETILIHAATGGIGSIALQIARLLGAGRIIGTVGSPEKIAYAQALAYDSAVLRADFVQQVSQLTAGRGVDVILDAAGEPTRSQSLSILAPFGRLVVFGNASNQPDQPLQPGQLLASNRTVSGYSISSLLRTAPHIVAATARHVLTLLASGQLHADATSILPLSQAADAHRLIESGRATGKQVLQVSS